MIALRFLIQRRGVSARIGSLIMVFQRTPLLKLLPEARVITTSGFPEAIRWTVTAIAGLGAFDAVSGASTIRQVQPFPDSPTVDAVAGEPLNFVWQAIGLPHTPASFSLGGEVPPGLVQTGLHDSAVDSLTGVPSQAGTYVMRVIAWELHNHGGDTFQATFTFNISNPPFPAITGQPAGGNFPRGAFVSLAAGQTGGKTFTWKLKGDALLASETVLFARAARRKFRVAPASDPGEAWRSGAPFDDTGLPKWNSISGGIGYDTDSSAVDFLTHIASGGDMQGAMLGPGKPVSVHLRMPFTLSTPAALSFFKLRVQSDDGFVAWINGTEVASQNRPATLTWNSASNGVANDTAAVAFREINITQHLGLLRAGDNLLAVQAMNDTDTSSDFLFNCELAAGINATNSPRLVLPSLQDANAGAYTLTVSNFAGSVTSDPAPVLILPTISSHPAASTSIESGATAQLHVIAEGSGPFSWQWYRGLSGDTVNPIPGANEASFTTPALIETTAFWVRVSTPAGIADSNTAIVMVNPVVPDTYATWTTAQFPPEDVTNPEVSGPAADPDGDLINNEREYVFGTTPLLPEPSPLPAITATGGSFEVRFTARRATGAGYTGRNRHYALETTGDVSTGTWTAVPLVSNVTGNDQTISCILPIGSTRTFCRLKIWLSP